MTLHAQHNLQELVGKLNDNPDFKVQYGNVFNYYYNVYYNSTAFVRNINIVKGNALPF